MGDVAGFNGGTCNGDHHGARRDADAEDRTTIRIRHVVLLGCASRDNGNLGTENCQLPYIPARRIDVRN